MCTEYTSVFSNSSDLVPVGQDTQWNLSIDYPFRDELPLIITRHSASDGRRRPSGEIYCSPDIDEWCLRHNITFKEFNHPCIISNTVTDCCCMFADLPVFNQPVVIPEGVISCACMFSGTKRFNYPVSIPNSVRNCRCMFTEAISFVGPVIVPDTVENRDYMFELCPNVIVDLGKHGLTLPVRDNLDAWHLKLHLYGSAPSSNCGPDWGYKFLDEPPVYITNPGCDLDPSPSIDIINWCKKHHTELSEFNHPCIIASELEDYSYMFYGLSSFNRPVYLHSAMRYCGNMFAHCTHFNEHIFIHGDVEIVRGMFFNAKSMSANKIHDTRDIGTRIGHPLIITRSDSSDEYLEAETNAKKALFEALEKKYQGHTKEPLTLLGNILY